MNISAGGKAATAGRLLGEDKILGHHDQYFYGGKPPHYTPSSMFPQLNNNEATFHEVVNSGEVEKFLEFMKVRF